ncbi:hypothetical protein MKW94_007461 [Papaver nudicaule]|uniref:Uncharacterized protein n=1 Tax=Papaver nudicaule TaxID=74823 RepID=A0AA42B4M8_PAPNU|nr:hypothetical protein [Papaver nudicaule]
MDMMPTNATGGDYLLNWMFAAYTPDYWTNLKLAIAPNATTAYVTNWMLPTATNTLAYWLNWRFLLCAIIVLSPMVFAAYLIRRYEWSKDANDEEENVTKGTLYADDAWRPCLKQIHPACLLAFRVFAFGTLLTFLVWNMVIGGAGIFFYYTQWTFASVIIYFGLGSLFSICGCYRYCTGASGDHAMLDKDRGAYVAPMPEENGIEGNISKSWDPEQHYVRKTAGTWGYIFQIMFQMNAGAVILTDSVYWLVLYPLLSHLPQYHYKPTLIVIVMHSLNAVFLLVDTILNCLQFPWFRISYFTLWTGIFVIFQWIIHACVSIWWPYPFLDLSSSYAPLWYLGVAVMHLPCYFFFALITKLKHSLLSKWFPNSYQYMAS